MAASAANPATPTATSPTAEDKTTFENAKKELVQALTKKRNADKQLVSLTVLPGRRSSQFGSGPSRSPAVSSRSLVPDRDHDKQRWEHYHRF